MNQAFDIGRFGRVFYKYTIEHYKSYLMSLVVLVGVLLLGGSFLVYMEGKPLDKGLQLVMFISTMLLSGTIFTSTIFSELGEKKKAMPWLLLPATHFEKFLVAWVYSFLVFIVVYTLSFNLVALLLLNARHFEGEAHGLFYSFNRQILEVYIAYAFLHGVAFWGAIYFNRMNFIKTAFTFFIFIGVLMFMNRLLLQLMLGRPVEAAAFFGFTRVINNGQPVDIVLKQGNSGFNIIYLEIAMALILWTAAYFNVKEKQV